MVHQQVAQMVRHALAEGQVDPVRMVDEQTHALAARALAGEHLHVRLGRGEAYSMSV